MYKFDFHEDVEKDLSKLDHSIRLLFEKKFKQILNNPEIGINLGNKAGLDLSGLKKVYFSSKKYRIVYKVDNNKIKIFVVSVGKRENYRSL